MHGPVVLHGAPVLGGMTGQTSAMVGGGVGGGVGGFLVSGITPTRPAAPVAPAVPAAPAKPAAPVPATRGGCGGLSRPVGTSTLTPLSSLWFTWAQLATAVAANVTTAERRNVLVPRLRFFA